MARLFFSVPLGHGLRAGVSLGGRGGCRQQQRVTLGEMYERDSRETVAAVWTMRVLLVLGTVLFYYFRQFPS
jgi:hypothetical protein